jgi:RNA polymerase sigma-70 factor (ECF subfamily)
MPSLSRLSNASRPSLPIVERNGAPLSAEGMGPVDRDLVEAARNGDRTAFADLVYARGDRLFGIAQRILRDVDRTEDAVQDALVIAWRDLPGLRDPDRFDAWLHRLLVRSCVAEAKRERRLVANLRVLPIDIPTATDDYLSVADRDQLERGFRHLSPEQRALIVLRHFAGLEPSEIAETLGIPAGTVRSRLHHAHRAMRAALDADARAIAIGGRSA